MPRDNQVVLVSQQGISKLKPTALDRTNPGTFQQTDHWTVGHRKPQKKTASPHVAMGGDPKAKCKYAGDVLAKDVQLVGSTAHTASRVSAGKQGCVRGQHETHGPLSSTMKLPSSVNSIWKREESSLGIKQDYLILANHLLPGLTA